MRRYSYMHSCSSILDWTVQSGPAFSQTGPDCSLRGPDCTVWSFYRSPFPSYKKTGPYGPVFLNGLQKRPRSRPDWTVASLFMLRPDLDIPHRTYIRTYLTSLYE